ncbi:hypothetical protein, conserved [Trypanosoma cruzi]|uniref:CMP/dCMP-type deaminase domain-containing protein n=2 Tax=Trypanosoma cruzi TaxID=5693 RepID=Q4D5T2_TRYCC|nr:hypothetical protein, conserved [Trypanosoma cruzi]EAN87880.1 hypothetical protein, conserved [Trypanosoma cruzi]|eukprot:XP_809731.1 hypothetical protein [Trypanosoma cruzi strain CL Brener]
MFCGILFYFCHCFFFFFLLFGNATVGMEEVAAPEAPPKLVRGVAIRIPRPTLSGAFLRIANNFFPLQPNARHLKRIRKAPRAEALLSSNEYSCTPSDCVSRCDNGAKEAGTLATTAEVSLELLLGVGCSIDVDRLKEFEELSGNAAPLTIITVLVPDRAPRTSVVEWKKWCALWPFAVPKPRPASPLSLDEMKKIKSVFNEAVMPLAKEGHNKGTLGIAALLVDSSQDWRVLTKSDGADLMQRSNAAACFGYVPAVESSENQIVLDHPVTEVLKKLARVQQAQRWTKDNVPYLANEIDLFVSHEPCVMCSMALVHSRVRRVFYCFANPTHGGLGSVFSIHTIPLLNHHFRVFRCSASWLCDESNSPPDSSAAPCGSSSEFLREP